MYDHVKFQPIKMRALKIHCIKMQVRLFKCILFLISALQQAFLFQIHLSSLFYFHIRPASFDRFTNNGNIHDVLNK